MKKKINWDVAIVLSLMIFIIFIVYIAFFYSNVTSQLISDRYYEDEIKYQETIEEKKNFLKLYKNIQIFSTPLGIKIIIPLYNEHIKGFLILLRFSSKDLDIKRIFEFPKYSYKKIFISKKILKKGYYKLIIRWKSNKNFFFEKKIYLE